MALGGGVGLGVVRAVKIPAGVLDQAAVHGLAVEDGFAQIQGNHGLVGHGLIHGHGLLAVHDVLQVGFVAVLTGDDGLVGSGVVRLDGLGNTQSGGVVGAQPGVDLGAVGVVGSQHGLSTVQSGGGIPLIGGHGVKVSLTGDHLQLAGLDEGIQHVHGALEEVAGVVIGGVTGGELDVEGTLGVVQIQGIHDILALQGTDGVVIKGHVVGNVVIHDQTVISDDGNASLAGLVHHGVQGLAVDGGHHQQIHALSDHVLDVADLTVGIVVGVSNDGLIAGALELLIQVRAVTVPPLQGLGGHGQTDLLGLAGVGTGTGAGTRTGSIAAARAGSQRQGHGRGQGKSQDTLFHFNRSFI